MKNDTEESLVEKLVLIFPEITARNRVIAVLNQYGTEPYEKEVVRVRLDILKPSGNSIEDVQRWVDIAKKDYRDILASAEYPSELLAPTWSMSKDETAIIRTTDRKQYEEWINKK
jgi:hypothetical protein